MIDAAPAGLSHCRVWLARTLENLLGTPACVSRPGRGRVKGRCERCGLTGDVDLILAQTTRARARAILGRMLSKLGLEFRLGARSACSERARTDCAIDCDGGLTVCCYALYSVLSTWRKRNLSRPRLRRNCRFRRRCWRQLTHFWGRDVAPLARLDQKEIPGRLDAVHSPLFPSQVQVRLLQPHVKTEAVDEEWKRYRVQL